MACNRRALAVSHAHILTPQVAADDREDAVTSWTNADTDATGNVYRLVQMSVAECHSSKTDEAGAMACVSQKKMATCHAASVNVGEHATQVSCVLCSTHASVMITTAHRLMPTWH